MKLSRFLTDLDVRRHVLDTSADKRGTWSLLHRFGYYSELLGHNVWVPKGFVTDFASVPRIPVAFLLAGNSAQEAAVIHDWLYTAHKVGRLEVTRAMADAVFKEAALASDVAGWRAQMMYLGVRIGGAGPYRADGQPQTEPEVRALVSGEAIDVN
jgi:hypothetical protein